MREIMLVVIFLAGVIGIFLLFRKRGFFLDKEKRTTDPYEKKKKAEPEERPTFQKVAPYIDEEKKREI